MEYKIEDFVLKLKDRYNNEQLSEEEREESKALGEYLVKLMTYEKMYVEDISRFNQYYEELSHTVDDLEELESEGDVSE